MTENTGKVLTGYKMTRIKDAHHGPENIILSALADTFRLSGVH
jgi:hypothetical protein